MGQFSNDAKQTSASGEGKNKNNRENLGGWRFVAIVASDDSSARWRIERPGLEIRGVYSARVEQTEGVDVVSQSG